jgi:hypothetical protein
MQVVCYTAWGCTVLGLIFKFSCVGIRERKCAFQKVQILINAWIEYNEGSKLELIKKFYTDIELLGISGGNNTVVIYCREISWTGIEIDIYKYSVE